MCTIVLTIKSYCIAITIEYNLEGLIEKTFEYKCTEWVQCVISMCMHIVQEVFFAVDLIDWTSQRSHLHWRNQSLNSVDMCIWLKRNKKKRLHAATERKQRGNNIIKSGSVCIILTNIVCDKVHFNSESIESLIQFYALSLRISQ